MADQNLTHAASLVPVAAHAGKPAMPLTRAVVTIGNGKHNRIYLKSDSVSTTHAILVHTEAGWYVRDLGSRTHTILNGKVAKEATLKNGDTLTIGHFVFEFKTDARGPETPVPPAALATEGELPLPIDTKTTVIGRRPGCEIRLEEESASNVHAILFEADGVHHIRDLYSRTGTWLNGVKVHQEAVKFGDEIRVGESIFRYEPDHSELYAPPAEEEQAEAAQVAILPPIPVDLDDAAIPVAPSARDTIDADGPEHADDGAPVLPLARRDVLNAGPLAADSFVAVEPTTPADDAIDLAPEPAPAEATPTPAVAAQTATPTEDTIDLAPESAADVEAEFLAPAETTPVEETVEPVEATVELASADAAEPAGESAADVEAELLELAPEAETTPVQDAIELAPAPAAEVAETIEPATETADAADVAIEPATTPVSDFVAPEAAQPVAPAEVAVDRRPPDVIATPAVALDVPPAPPADSVPAAAPEAVDRFADNAEAPVIVDEDEEATLATSAAESPLEPSSQSEALPDEAASLAKLEAEVQAALDDPTRPLPPLLAPGATTADANARLGEAGRRTRLIAEMLERHEDIEAEAEESTIEFAAPEPVGMAAPADEDLLAGQAPLAEPEAIAPPAVAPITDEVAPLEFADVPIEAVLPPLPEFNAAPAPLDINVEPLGFDTPIEEIAPIEDSLAERADTLTPLVEPVTVDAEAGPIVAPPVGSAEPHSAEADDVVVSPAAEAVSEPEVAPSIEPIESALATAPDSLETIAAAPTPEPLPADDATDVPQAVAIESDEAGVPVDDAQAPIEADAVGAGDVIATAPVVVTGPLPDAIDRATEAERAVEAERAELEKIEASTAAKGRRGKAAKKVAPKKPAAPKGRGRKGKTVAETPEAPPVDAAAGLGPVAAGSLAEVASAADLTPAAEVTPIQIDVPTAPTPEVVAEAALQDDEADVLGLDTAAPPADVAPAAVVAPTPVDFAAQSAAADEIDVDDASTSDEPELLSTSELASADDVEAEFLGLAPAAADQGDDTAVALDIDAADRPATPADPIAQAALDDDEADVLGLAPTADLVESADASPDAEAPRTADGISAELAAAQAALGLAPEMTLASESGGPSDVEEPIAPLAEVDAVRGAGSPGGLVTEPTSAAAEATIDQAALDAAAGRVETPAADDEIRPMLASPLPLEIGDAPVEALVALDAAEATDAPAAAAELDLPTPLEQDARPLIAADEHLDDRELRAIDAGELPAAGLAAAPLPTINSDSLTVASAAPPVADALPDTLPADAVAGAAIVIGDAAVSLVDAGPGLTDVADAGVGFVNQFAEAGTENAAESIDSGPADLARQAMASGDVALDLIAADEVTAPDEDLGAVGGAVDPVVAAEMVAEPEHLMSLTPAEPTPHEVVHAPSEAIGDDRTNAERLSEFAEPPPPTADSSMVVQADEPTAVMSVALPTAEEVEQVSHDAFADALAMADGKSFAEPAATRGPIAKDPNDPWVLDDSLLKQAEADAADAAASGAAPATPAHLAGFLNLGGIGYIGDPALDEYEPATPHKRVARPTRTPRQRRPLADESGPTVDEIGPPPANPHVADVPPGQTPPALPGEAVAEADVFDEADLADEAGIADDAAAGRPTRPAAPPAAPTTAPLAPAMPMSLPPRPRRAPSAAPAAAEAAPLDPTQPTALPPRPRRLPPRGQATVDQSLSPAAASPFAGQTLPLVDVFGGQGVASDAFGGGDVPVERLDEMLAKLGPTTPALPDEGNPLPITTDQPAANGNATPANAAQGSTAGLSSTPFASHVPIAQPGPPRRRPPAAPRRPANNLSRTLMWVMIGLSALTAGAAWYWPVARSVYGEVAFKNIDRLNTVERRRVEDELRQKVAGLRAEARKEVDDRFGDGFLDRENEFRALVAAAEFRDEGESPNKQTLMIFRRPSDANRAFADRKRLDALLKVTREANEGLLVAQRQATKALKEKREQIEALQKTKAAINGEIDQAKALADNRVDASELRRVEQDVDRLDAARKAAAKTLAAREAEFKRLEAEAAALGATAAEGVALADRLEAAAAANDAAVANVGRSIDAAVNLGPWIRFVTGRTSPLASLATVASPATGIALFAVEETPAATTAADPELARLTRDRNAARERLEQLLAGQAPEARTARESFDQALEAFAGDVEKAGKALGDRPEVLAYVQSARALQDQIRRMTDTLVRRQQQQITRLGEFKRRLSELTEATREQRFGDDEQLKTWNDQLAIRQRQLNAAREAGAPKLEIDDTQREVAMLESMIAARKELLNDPRASVVTKELEGMIATTQREMLQDRADNEKLLADVQEAFRRQQPAVEKLPDDQKELARQLAGRLAQIDLARQRYTNSLGIQAGGEALQIAQARQKLQELDDAVALRKSTVDAGAQAQAAEMERRTRLAKQRDEARIALVAARSARDDAEAAYAARVKTRDALAARLQATKAAGDQQEDATRRLKDVEAQLGGLLVESNALEQQVNFAVVPIAANPAVEIAPTRVDPRLIGGTLGVAAIVLCMGPFVWNAYRREREFAAMAEAAAAAEATVDAAEPTTPRRPRDPFPPASPNFPSHVTPA